MLQIVHDLAPAAELYFATAFYTEANFAQAILDLRNAGCDIIVDDISYLGESVWQDGVIAQAVSTVTADGALYFSSAGNAGNLNDGTSGVWEGDFLDAYNAGRQLYTLQGNVNRATAGINSRQNELDRIDEDILESEAELINRETTTERRIMLLAELKNLSEHIGELDAEIEDLYEQRARYRMELEQYQVALLDYGY